MLQKQVSVWQKNLFLFLSFFIYIVLIPREPEEEEQLKIGNFAVSGSVQPGTLFGFGQNVITEHEAIASIFSNWMLGKNKNFFEIIPYFVYGISDRFSLLLSFPTAVKFKVDDHSSSGSEDLIVMSEYAFYAKNTPTMTNQCTLVTGVYLPTGNECKNPVTGFGSPSFFLGVTAAHFTTEWYYYTSYAALLTTKHDNSKAGNQFFYQAGFGKNIAYSPNKWTLAWIVDLYGWYEQKAKVNGIIDQNSGFNTLMVGPSLDFSTEQISIQGGVAPVITQHLFGEQSKNSVFVALSFTYRFY